MWYFSWVLGVGLACSFSVLNAVWLEYETDQRDKSKGCVASMN